MAAESRPEVVLGLVAGSGRPYELAAQAIDEVQRELNARLPGIRWRIELVENGLVQPPAGTAEIVAAARQLLLDRDWDLLVCLTELPLRADRRPVVAHVSSLHGVGLLSLPALGPVGVRRRVPTTVLRIVDGLLGEADPETDGDELADRRDRLARRAKELATDVDDDQALRFTARVLTGNLRVLAGMVRANQPWRLALDLSRALTAAIAAGVFALVTPDIWRLADAYGGVRLTGVAVAAVAAVAITLIIGAGLWERGQGRRMRQQVVLFNTATVITVSIGVLAFYGALFVVSAAATPLLLVGKLLAEQLGHPVGLGDYLKLAWLTSSLAMAGGALGAGLESDDAVREAAYTNRATDDSSEEVTTGS